MENNESKGSKIPVRVSSQTIDTADGGVTHSSAQSRDVKRQPSSTSRRRSSTSALSSPGMSTVLNGTAQSRDGSGIPCPTSNSPIVHTRENRASLGRKLMTHSRHLAEKAESESNADYLTPLQKKDRTIQDLRQELKEALRSLVSRDEEIGILLSEKDRNAHALESHKNEGELKK